MISLKKLCSLYFKKFSDKDLDGLSEMFSNKIQLNDWDIKVYGKDNVLKSIDTIYSNVEDIQAVPNSFYEDGNTVCCDITITIDNNEKIDVMDIITFNDLFKIEKIKAYKK